VTRQKGSDTAVDRPWCRDVSEGEKQIPRFEVNVARNVRIGKNRFDLAGENEFAFDLCVKERLDAEAIPHEDEIPGAFVPEGKSEHSDQIVPTGSAFPRVRREDYLGIGSTSETFACALHFPTELKEVENLAVIRNPELLVWTAHRLMSRCGKVEDAQAPVSQCDVATHTYSAIVRATMADPLSHRFDKRTVC
jgi:hypothetical protein